MSRLTVPLLLGALALASCRTAAVRSPSGTPRADASRLLALHDSRDFFALDSLLAASPDLDSPLADLLRAEVAHAFNRPEASNAILRRVEAREAALPDSLRVLLYRLRYRNDLRLHRYAPALASARTLLATTHPDSATRFDVENDARFLEAVRDVPPQQVVRRGASIIHRGADTRVPVLIADSSRAYVLDTGANLSGMMRSEAEALGLEIRPAGILVGSVTGHRVEADVAVVDRLRIGNVELANVVFIVLPDAVLTFQDGAFKIPGILGFPVVEALGEVRFAGGTEIRVPAEVPDRPVRNLALDFLDPLVRVGVFDDSVICRLDSGASRTTFYRPLYLRHRALVESLGEPDTVTSTGVGGSRRLVAYVLPKVRITLGDTVATVEGRPVLTESVADSPDDYLACNVGLDVLRSFPEYVLNFRSMTFLLR